MAQIIASTYEICSGDRLRRRRNRLSGPASAPREMGGFKGGPAYAGGQARGAAPGSRRHEKSVPYIYPAGFMIFVEEDGVVYTVMDYVEGESLDKPPETWGAICPSPGGGVGLPAAGGPVLSSQPAAPWNPPRGHQAGQCYAHPGERYPAH